MGRVGYDQVASEAATRAAPSTCATAWDGFTQVAADPAQDRIPARPFVLGAR